MRRFSNDAGQIKIDDLIEAARNEPVTILENGGPVALVLSPSEFHRLEEQDRIRQGAKARLRETISALQREAADRGLTETELERLLSDES
jgi:prevent-host-death family protein